MDFSGKAGGRVIQNPAEAQSAEKEEGEAWRVRNGRRQRKIDFNMSSNDICLKKVQSLHFMLNKSLIEQ